MSSKLYMAAIKTFSFLKSLSDARDFRRLFQTDKGLAEILIKLPSSTYKDLYSLMEREEGVFCNIFLLNHYIVLKDC